MTQTGIQWLDDLAAQRGATPVTWNPIRGCRRTSAGCENCYAEAIAYRFRKPGQVFEGLIDERTGKWNGKTRLIENRMDAPRRWHKPRVVWINSAFDLFMPGIPDAWRDQIIARVLLHPEHLFLGLTKYADEMRAYFNDPFLALRIATILLDLGTAITPYEVHQCLPLKNLWLGTTAENQEAADKRIPALLDTPAVLHFVSCEPLIGAVDLVNIGAELDRFGIGDNALDGIDFDHHLQWVLIGGENGTHARPLHPDWRDKILDQCTEHAIAAYDKQPGEWAQTEVYTALNWPIRVDGDTGERRPLKDSAPRCNDAIMSRVGHKKAESLHPPKTRQIPTLGMETSR